MNQQTHFVTVNLSAGQTLVGVVVVLRAGAP
jgi:hypothetical protein